MSILAAGTVEAPDTRMSADARLCLQRQAAGGDTGDLNYTKTAGIGFTSSSLTDTAVIERLLVEKA